MAITKEHFMIRLRHMVDYVGENHDELSLYCPASKEATAPFVYPYNKINSTMCHICNEVMETDICPCDAYDADEALFLAKEKIKKYFG